MLINIKFVSSNVVSHCDFLKLIKHAFGYVPKDRNLEFLTILDVIMTAVLHS